MDPIHCTFPQICCNFKTLLIRIGRGLASRQQPAGRGPGSRTRVETVAGAEIMPRCGRKQGCNNLLPVRSKYLPIRRVERVRPCLLAHTRGQLADAAVHEADIHGRVVRLAEIGVRRHG